MSHLILAYDILVLMLGFAALCLAILRAVRPGEGGRGAFSAIYALFTAMMASKTAERYLSANLPDLPFLAYYWLSGAGTLMHFFIVFAAMLFFHRYFRFKRPPWLEPALAALTIALVALVFLPGGVELRAEESRLVLKAPFFVASGLSLACYAYALGLGYLGLARLKDKSKRGFAVGFLAFASIGFAETVLGFFATLANPSSGLDRSGPGFLVSSIPYAIYSAFLIVMQAKPVQAGRLPSRPTPGFIARYGVSEREAEVVAGSMAGKSNESIAAELFISIATVKTHLHNVFRKAGVKSRHALNRLAGED